MDKGYYDEDIEDLAPSVDPERSVTVDRYATTMEEALGFVSFPLLFEGNVYIVSRMLFPASVSANEIDLQILPSARKVHIFIKKSALSSESLVGCGMPLAHDKDSFQAYHQAYFEAIQASKKNAEDEVKHKFVFDLPITPEPQASADIPNFPAGKGLRRVKYSKDRDEANVFYWVLKQVGSLYKITKKVKKEIVLEK